MSTPYRDIYLRFTEKVTDYDFLNFTDEENDALLHNLMISSCSQFIRCQESLTDRDDTAAEFSDDLSDASIEIIVQGMIVEWLKPRVYKSKALANFLNKKDLNLAASPANMLKELRETLKECQNEFKRLMIEYTYNNSDASEL